MPLLPLCPSFLLCHFLPHSSSVTSSLTPSLTPPLSLPPSFLLLLILSFSSLTSPFVPHLSPSLQSTFKLGLSFLPLANAGLDALEAWNAELPAELLKPHFRHILPYLDDYLKTLGVAGLSQ